MKLGRRDEIRRTLCLFLISTTLFLFAETAQAFRVPNRGVIVGQAIAYKVHRSFIDAGLSVHVLHLSEHAWEVQQLHRYVNFYHSDAEGVAREVSARAFDPASKAHAQSTQPCDHGCTMEFNTRRKWNTTTELRDASWIDQFSVGTHEFGHWFGLDHSGKMKCEGTVEEDIPATDGQRPSMGACDNRDGRDLAQDDMNGAHVARPQFPIITGNDSFEYTSPFYGFNFSGPNGGSLTRYCNDVAGAWHGVCFVQFNGVASSYMQDHHMRGILTAQQGIRGRVRVRNRSTSTSASTVIAVFFLDTGGSRSFRCGPLPAGKWVRCWTEISDNPDGNVRLRLQVYNERGANMDIETLILGALQTEDVEGPGGGQCISDPIGITSRSSTSIIEC